MDLDGATCLITGANRGIGLAIAERLAEEPARLLVGVRELSRNESIKAPQGGASEIRPVHMDLSSRESIDAAWMSWAASSRPSTFSSTTPGSSPPVSSSVRTSA